jgi:outer membrane protein TolC
MPSRRSFKLALLLLIVVPSVGGAQASTISSEGATTQRFDALVDSLRRALVAASPALRAREHAIEAARARVLATGRSEPAALAAEVEEVRGLDFSSAQSLKLQVERDFTPRAVGTALRQVAQSDVRAAEAERVLAERRLVATIDRGAVALSGWAAIARRLAAEDSLLVSAEASLRARFAVADARYVDVLRMRTERLRVQSERAAAASEGLMAGRRLVGLAASDTAIAVARTLTRQLAALPPSATLLTATASSFDVDSMLEQSGQLALADVPVLRAEAERQLAEAQRRPQIGGFVGIERFADERGYPIGPRLGATVSLPFTAGATLRARATAAERELEAATARRRAARAELRATLLAARDRLDAARARVASFDAALLRGARDERESALASFRAGQLTLVELLDFERALARAEIDRLRSLIDAADAHADLVSGGTHADFSSTSTASRTDDQ